MGEAYLSSTQPYSVPQYPVSQSISFSFEENSGTSGTSYSQYYNFYADWEYFEIISGSGDSDLKYKNNNGDFISYTLPIIVIKGTTSVYLHRDDVDSRWISNLIMNISSDGSNFRLSSYRTGAYPSTKTGLFLIKLYK